MLSAGECTPSLPPYCGHMYAWHSMLLRLALFFLPFISDAPSFLVLLAAVGFLCVHVFFKVVAAAASA